MKKRLLCRLLAVFTAICLMCGMSGASVSALASGNMTEKLVSVLSNISRDILIPALPFVCSDTGLDMLDDALSKHQNGQNAGLLGSVIVQALEYTDPVTLQNLFDTLRLFDESFRQECQGIYQNCEALSLTESESKGIEALLSLAGTEKSDLEAVMYGHQVSAGMIAKMMQATKRLSGGTVKFAMNDSGKFYIQSVPTALLNRIAVVWQADGMTVNLQQELTNGAEKLNTMLTQAERNSVGLLFYKVGMMDQSPTYTPPTHDVDKLPSGGSGSYVKDEVKENADLQEAFTVTESGTISVACAYKNPVVYKIAGEALVPVKMSLYINGIVVAELTEGQYIIKEESPYFSDCEGWYQPYIEALYARGIINGKAEKIFAPKDTITREEFVKLMIELFDMHDPKAQTTFTDVSEDAWYYSYVASAQKYGIVNGISATEFGVGQEIRRQDMAKIINETLTKKGLTAKPGDVVFGDHTSISDYALNHVMAVYSFGIVSGDDQGYFKPLQSATRGEAAKMIYGVLRTILMRGE